MSEKDKLCSMLISEKEYALLKHLREIKYGRIAVFLEEGQPVRSEEGIKSRKY